MGGSKWREQDARQQTSSSNTHGLLAGLSMRILVKLLGEVGSRLRKKAAWHTLVTLEGTSCASALALATDLAVEPVQDERGLGAVGAAQDVCVSGDAGRAENIKGLVDGRLLPQAANVVLARCDKGAPGEGGAGQST